MLSRETKRLIAVAMIVHTLCACTKRENEPQSPATAPPTTRGDAVAFMPVMSRASASTFVPGDQLGVCAYATDKDGNWNVQSRPELMYNTEITKTGAGYFSYFPTLYYPANEDRLKFFAYYPYAASPGDNGITLSTSTQAGYPSIDFDASVGSYSIDMLAAVTEAQNSGSVMLECNHLLTKLNVSAKSLIIAQGIRVKEVKIGNINSTGRFSWDNYTNRAANPETWWSNQSGAVTIDESIDVLIGNTEYTPLFSNVKMVVPQIQNSVTLEISYTFPSDERLYTKRYTQNVTWVAGGSVNYTIDILAEQTPIPIHLAATQRTSMSK